LIDRRRRPGASTASKTGTHREVNQCCGNKAGGVAALGCSNLGVDLEAEAARVGREQPAEEPRGRRFLLRRRHLSAARRPTERHPRGWAAARRRRSRRREEREQQEEGSQGEAQRRRGPHGGILARVGDRAQSTPGLLLAR
jgi:hypothetical protein